MSAPASNPDVDGDGTGDDDGDAAPGPDRVREALESVVDPCSAATGSNLDIVEMGLVKSVDVADRHVDVEMRLTTPLCHMVPYFAEEVESAVGDLPGVDSVELTTDGGFEWTEELMSDEAKRRRRAVLDEHRSRFEAEAAERDATDG
ncbi:metal-sulfur cluster assembly factor [Halobaculum sp. D14]|uniref:metal-sulfur cluster assembly factor n=1 Tax=Halobaculum sp. D14 TaxID=3421642 RepID=UPI003EC0F598